MRGWGSGYPPTFLDRVWTGLSQINKNPSVEEAINDRQPSENLRRQIFGSVVITRTGRIRTGADYGEARNTPFQGLAADGAKAAAWKLYQHGFKIVAFVHDEFVVEIDDVGAEINVGQRDLIIEDMKQGMASVVGNDMPIEVEAVLSRTWTK